nr:hypothetical protein [Intestinimonas timonensis]
MMHEWSGKTPKGSRGRGYRRLQNIKHGEKLLFLIRHLGYAPHIGYIDGGFDSGRLLHSGFHIKQPRSSGTQQYLKRKTSRAVRRCTELPPKGNRYRRLVEYWWTLY